MSLVCSLHLLNTPLLALVSLRQDRLARLRELRLVLIALIIAIIISIIVIAIVNIVIITFIAIKLHLVTRVVSKARLSRPPYVPIINLLLEAQYTPPQTLTLGLPRCWGANSRRQWERFG